MSDEQKPKSAGMSRRTFLSIAAGGTVAAATVGLAGLIATPSFQRFLAYRGKGGFDFKDLPPMEDPATSEKYNLKDIVAETLETAATDDKGTHDNFVVWHSQKLEPGKKTLVFFPSNGGHLGYSPSKTPLGDTGGNGNDYIDLIKAAQIEGYQVVFVNHVGFMGSNVDSPTQEKLYQGAERTIEWLLHEKNMEPNDLHIAGISLGAPIAAHAANRLAFDGKFIDDIKQKQHVNLMLINGLINVDPAIDAAGLPGTRTYAKMVAQDRLDTGHELMLMGLNNGKDRIRVHYLRSLNDPHTPADQTEAHANAAANLKFTEEKADAPHFVKPSVIIDAFQKMDPVNKRVNDAGRAEGRQ